MMNRRTIVNRGLLVVLALVLGLLLVRSVKKADVVLIRQQQDRNQLERKLLSDRRQQEEATTHVVQQAPAIAKQQTKLEAIEEEQLVWNRTRSDPAPPAGADNIKGEWWFSELTPNKTYIYIENVNSDIVEASLPGGRKMSLRCAVTHSTDSTSYVDDSPVCTGLSQSYHSWVRVSMGSTFESGSRAPAEGWSLLWHDRDRVEIYHIQSFCDPSCTLQSDKVEGVIRAEGTR